MWLYEFEGKKCVELKNIVINMKMSMSIFFVFLVNMNIMKWYIEIIFFFEGEDYIRVEGIFKMIIKVLLKLYRNF